MGKINGGLLYDVVHYYFFWVWAYSAQY